MQHDELDILPAAMPVCREREAYRRRRTCLRSCLTNGRLRSSGQARRPVTLDYYVWLEEGRLATRSAEFRVACIIPMKGFAADRDLVPDYPGITESETLSDWDPPFPIDLKRIRPQDEDYWKKYRTTPKAFIPLEVGTRALADRVSASSLRFASRPDRDKRSLKRIGLRAKPAREARSTAHRFLDSARPQPGSGSFARSHRLWRIFSLFQFFPGRLGAAIDGALLQAGYRTTFARDWVAAGRWFSCGKSPQAVSFGRSGSCRRRQLDWFGRRSGATAN